MKNIVLSSLLLFLLGGTLRGQEKVVLRPDVEVYPLAKGIWRHVTYLEMKEWGMTPANGLIVADGDSAALIDTPWTPEQTAALLDWVEKTLQAKVEIVVVGHHHRDCLGGLPEIHRRGIRSIGSGKTRELALGEGVEAPKEGFAGRVARLEVGRRALELFYPGPGHTPDNIVTWIADGNVLFGGCFVKPADARALGYTTESDLSVWPASLAGLKKRYPQARVIVPGHGDPGGWELVDNTLRLIAKQPR